MLVKCNLATTNLNEERIPLNFVLPTPNGRTCEYIQLTNFLLQTQELAPQLVRMTSLGKSIQGTNTRKQPATFF